MPTTVTVLYPNTSDSTFNLEYYTSSHMPMVAEQFGPYGFKGTQALYFQTDVYTSLYHLVITSMR